MKTKVFIVVILVLFFSSCGNHVNNKNLDLSKIEVIKSLDEIRLDSINKLEELKVLGSITFGMNRDEFEKSKAEFEEKCKTDRGKYIGDYRYSYISGYFYNEKLYYVEVIGQRIGYESYERTMTLQYEALLNVLKNKYGSPYPENKLPPWHLMSEGKQYYLVEWYNLGDKKINMMVDCKGQDYTLNIEIYKPSINEIINIEREAEKKSSIKKGVDLL